MSNTPYVDIIFGPYEPDWGGLPRQEMQGYLVDAVGVRMTPNGYRGMPTFADVTSATAIGGASFTSAHAANFYTLTNVAFFVVDGNAKIWESRAEGTDTWEDVTPAAGTLDQFGDFLRFADDVIYVCSSRAPISKDLAAAHATDFASLAGSPPTAKAGARIGQHVVLGQLSTDPYAIQTSAFGDHEDWPTPGTADARSKQAITESLNSEFGVVQWVLGGEKFGIVMQEHAMTRMTYVGGSRVYEFDIYERSIGSGSQYARPATDGRLWYTYNESGVYATDGYSAKNISDGKIDESLFLDTIGHPLGTQISSAFSSAFDARRGLVLFGGKAYGGGTSYQLAYSVAEGQFSLLSETNRMVFFQGYRVDGTKNLDGRQIYNVNGSNRKLQRLSAAGTPTIAMQTGYVEIDPGYNVQLQSAHLLGTGTGSLTLAYKTAASSAACDVSQSGFTSMTAAGLGQKKTARATAQYMAFRVTGTGAESQLIRGIRVYYTRAQPAT